MLKELHRETVYKGSHLTLQNIHLEGGKIYESCSRVGDKTAVSGLLRHTEKRNYVLIEQYRYPVQNKVLELVAGLTDKKGLSKVELLLEEIEEETGYKKKNIGNIELLSRTAGSAGKSTETTQVYDVEITGEPGKQDLGEMEDIEVIEVPYKEFDDFLHEKLNQGVIISSDVCMAIYMTLQKTGKYL